MVASGSPARAFSSYASGTIQYGVRSSDVGNLHRLYGGTARYNSTDSSVSLTRLSVKVVSSGRWYNPDDTSIYGTNLGMDNEFNPSSPQVGVRYGVVSYDANYYSLSVATSLIRTVINITERKNGISNNIAFTVNPS